LAVFLPGSVRGLLVPQLPQTALDLRRTQAKLAADLDDGGQMPVELAALQP
jgi:hypothetical protein